MIAHAPGMIHCRCKFCFESNFMQVSQNEIDDALNPKFEGQPFPSLDTFDRIFIMYNICKRCYEKRYLNLGDRNQIPLESNS